MNGLLFITHITEKYDTIASVAVALKGGCRSVQLRRKDADPGEILEVGRIVKKMCDEVQAELYIDDYPGICKELGVTGVHLGKKDMPVSEARKLLGEKFIIGGTANSWDDVVKLHREGADYIGLGPFRFTTTKKNLSPVLGLDGYRIIMEKCTSIGLDLPVLAIGGITKEDIPVLMQTGIAGIALSSSILQAENPVQETKELIKIIKQYTL